MSDSLCLQCGMCCWDWKNNDTANKCEHLAKDMATCTAYNCLASVNREECATLMDIHQACDLPPTCGYVT